MSSLSLKILFISPVIPLSEYATILSNDNRRSKTNPDFNQVLACTISTILSKNLRSTIALSAGMKALTALKDKIKIVYKLDVRNNNCIPRRNSRIFSNSPDFLSIVPLITL